MPDWKITARTLYCEAVADEVTFLITGDGTVDCTGRQKYCSDGDASSRAVREHSRKTGRTISCAGMSCQILQEYAARVLSGEPNQR